MDGGYALKLPVEAIAKFRILTQSAPPEYGGTGGATTSVVTRSGSNQFNGNLYEFIRNDVFDARNFFSEEVEPLRQNQFGGTIGGPIARDRLQFFGYYEGFRTSRVHDDRNGAERSSAHRRLLGHGHAADQLRCGRSTDPRQPHPCRGAEPGRAQCDEHVSARQHRTDALPRNGAHHERARSGRWANRLHAVTEQSVLGRYSYSGGHNINPVSVRGTDAPGFPTRDDLATHIGTLSNTAVLSPSMTNSLRATYLRHEFFFDQRLNQTPPSAFGFGYTSANDVGQGPPFFNVAGYSPIGGAITGPRNTTQDTFEIHDSVTWSNRAHLVKIGGEFRHTGIDMIQGIAPNAFYVFASNFPTNNAIANLLLGAPVVFYQGLGDFERGIDLWVPASTRRTNIASRRGSR